MRLKKAISSILLFAILLALASRLGFVATSIQLLPDGIAPSDDPLLSARSAVYARSFTRRAGEPKQPSAIDVAQVPDER